MARRRACDRPRSDDQCAGSIGRNPARGCRPRGMRSGWAAGRDAANLAVRTGACLDVRVRRCCVSDQPSEEEVRHWARRFASQSNNRAWDLVEQAERTDAETDEMLHAAHASARLWSTVGTELNAARSNLLLGVAHGLAGNGRLAQRYAQAAQRYLSANDCPDWEAALMETALAAAA